MVFELCSGRGLVAAWRVSIAEIMIVLEHAKTFVGGCGVREGVLGTRGSEDEQGAREEAR